MLLCAATLIGGAMLAACAGGTGGSGGAGNSPARSEPTAVTDQRQAAGALSSKPATRGPTPYVPRGATAINAGNPTSAVVGREAWTFEDKPGQVIHTRSVSIYTTESEAIITDRLPGFMEAALEAYTTLITPLPRPTSRLESFVMGSRAQWQRLTLYMMGERGKNFTWIERGGFAFGGRAFLFDIGAADTMAIASHEGWHQFTQRTFQEPLPVWLEEGVATYFEGHRWNGADVTFLPWYNIERFDRLRDAAAKQQLLPFQQVLEMTPDRLVVRTNDVAVTYYAQLWALVHFFLEADQGRYRDAFRQLLADSASGRVAQRLAEASGGRISAVMMSQRLSPLLIRTYFGLEVDQLAQRYEAFIRQVVVPGSRNAIVAGRSPVSAE
jgi:hypothetical protein